MANIEFDQEAYKKPHTEFGPEILDDLTENELKVLREYGDYEYMDYEITQCQSNYGWSFAEDVAATINKTTRSASGVIGSLAKKGFLHSEGSRYRGDAGFDDAVHFYGKMIAANLFLNHENDWEQIEKDYDPETNYLYHTQSTFGAPRYTDNMERAKEIAKEFGGKIEVIAKSFIDGE